MESRDVGGEGGKTDTEEHGEQDRRNVKEHFRRRRDVGGDHCGDGKGA